MNVGLFPLISSIVSFLFSVTVLDQYFARRKSFQLLWTIGLFLYGISTFIEFRTETYGMTDTAYRLWYLFGALYVAAYLGMGTIYLLARQRTAHIIMAVLLVVSVFSAIRVFTANIDLSGATNLAQRGVMPGDVRGLAALLNTFGTVALVGGAMWSAWVFWRKRILPHRVVSNILIAIGALLPAVGGTTLTFGGPRVPFYTLELLGIIIIFAGFLRTREVFGFFRFPLVHGLARVETESSTPPAKTPQKK